jgi:hypothetical protein
LRVKERFNRWRPSGADPAVAVRVFADVEGALGSIITDEEARQFVVNSTAWYEERTGGGQLDADRRNDQPERRIEFREPHTVIGSHTLKRPCYIPR